jgi:glyoxylase-like metal-dependent hydrolase (beta-lactamase superfamily II)
MWSKMEPCDAENMITLQTRCLLVVEGSRNILIDTGVGNKQEEKFRKHFYPHDEQTFQGALSQIGLRPEDITDVILTHFHFDHVGGALALDAKGNCVPAFPNATYWTNEKHYRWAYDPNAREAASFLKENFVPLKEMGMLRFIDVEPGVKFSDTITIDFVYGHTEAMMLPHIQLPTGNTLVYCADLIPYRHHIPLPYIMSYDVRPLETLKEKQAFIEKVSDGRHYLFFEHDPSVACGTLLMSDTGKASFGQEVRLEEII